MCILIHCVNEVVKLIGQVMELVLLNRFVLNLKNWSHRSLANDDNYNIMYLHIFHRIMHVYDQLAKINVN